MTRSETHRFFNALGRVPKRATLEQMRAAFKTGADMLIEGFVSRSYMERRDDGFYYPTAAGKRALADFRSTR